MVFNRTKVSLILPLIVVVAVGLTSEGRAAVLGFTDATFSSDPADPISQTPAILQSYTTSAGTVSSLAAASTALDGSFDLPNPDNGVPDPDHKRIMNFWATQGTETDGAAAALTLDASTGISNVRFIDVLFGAELQGAPGNGNDIFLMEISTLSGSNDGKVVVLPLDAAGKPLGDFSLIIDAPSQMTNSGTGINHVGDHGGSFSQNLVGVAFDLEDFSGTGTLGHIHGIRVDPDDKFLDLAVIGFNTEAVVLQPPTPDDLASAESELDPKQRPRNKCQEPFVRSTRRAGSRQMVPDTFFSSDSNPFDRQVAQHVEGLESETASIRAGAAEALAYLRAYTAADALADRLDDPDATVRRESVMALAWCGGRDHVPTLIEALDDPDWVVRQAAWIALTNLVGVELPFDALATAGQRERQVATWRRWWAKTSRRFPPVDVLMLLDQEDLECQLRGVRALGAMGGPGASEAVLRVITPYRDMDYGKLTPLEKHLVQAGLRSLGRLRQIDAFEPLLAFFGRVGWARYAADALGEFGDRRAVAPLIAAYPSYAWGLKREVPKLFPPDDVSQAGMSPEDRMYETAYATSVALARLPLDTRRDTEALRRIGPHLAANLPSDWDTAMLYEPEAFEVITAWLLDRAGLRRTACEAAFRVALLSAENPKEPISGNPDKNLTPQDNLFEVAKRSTRDIPWFTGWLPALCRDKQDVPRLIGLLEHHNGWVRINAAKALMFLDAKEAIEPIAEILSASKTEAEHGYSGVREHAEYNDPAPRWREAFVRALGRLGSAAHAPLLIKILEDDHNVLEVRYAAAVALGELETPEVVASLKRAEAAHPFHSVRMVAREALWRRGARPSVRRTAGLIPAHQSQETTAVPSDARDENASVAVHAAGAGTNPAAGSEKSAARSRERELDVLVFIKGDNQVHSDFNDQSGIDPFRQTYSVTNSGPTYRRGRNLYLLRRAARDGPAAAKYTVTPLTRFRDGYVSSCEVSSDGRRVIFARRADGDTRYSIDVNRQERSHEKLEHEPQPDSDPWWHIWEINVDGTGLRQLTFGPYHDVEPAYLPDGRVVFSSSRIGMRDEYHGYLCTGLSVMNADGSDIRPIGFNLGGDREPAVLPDGRIVYSRLDLFYSRLKTECTIQAVFPDGRGCVTLYGPERREFWHRINSQFGEEGWGVWAPRHRVLRLTQPQPLDASRLICASSGGLTIVGPGRYEERIIPHDKRMAVTCPFPLRDGRILCAATRKQFKSTTRHVANAVAPDLGLYLMNADTGEMTLLYNDPATADFEARPITPRTQRPVLDEAPNSRTFTARLICNSARITQLDRVRTRGRFIRIVEGMPVVSRHQTQQNRPGNRWRNHGGTHARILGTAPLAADGSFFAEVPADRLIHLQVLDADRQVVGNQLIWMYLRPGETRSCIGCHERPDTAHLADHIPLAATVPPVRMLPTGGEFTYRAKVWTKGVLPDEAEERSRTVRAVSLIGRQ